MILPRQAIRRWGGWGARLLVTCAILVFLFRQVSWAQVWNALTAARGAWVLAAVGLSLIAHLMWAARLKLLTDHQGMSLSLRQHLAINWSALFYGLFLPGGNLTGGAIRFYQMTRRDRQLPEALAALLVDRALATVSLLVVGLAFWLLDAPLGVEVAVLALAGMGLGGAALIGAKRWVPWVAAFGGRAVGRRLGKVGEAIARYRRLPWSAAAWIVAWSIGSQLIGVLLFYALAWALGVDVPLLALGWVRSATVLATMVPVSIAGLGLREGALLFLLDPFGVAGEEALAMSLLVFAVTVLLFGLLGGLLEGKRFLLPAARAQGE